MGVMRRMGRVMWRGDEVTADHRRWRRVLNCWVLISPAILEKVQGVWQLRLGGGGQHGEAPLEPWVDGRWWARRLA
jgi:hypothetical protein